MKDKRRKTKQCFCVQISFDSCVFTFFLSIRNFYINERKTLKKKKHTKVFRHEVVSSVLFLRTYGPALQNMFLREPTSALKPRMGRFFQIPDFMSESESDFGGVGVRVRVLFFFNQCCKSFIKNTFLFIRIKVK